MFVTPRKKRPASELDEDVLTPKKVRIAPPTPPPTKHKSTLRSPLPAHLNRLLELHKSIEQSLSMALASSGVGFIPTTSENAAVTPSSHMMPDVTDHISMAATGSSRRLSVDDLSRLVWLWEWDGETLPDRASAASSREAVNDDPFVDITKGWTRGGLGIIVSQTTRTQGGKRVPAYGLGISVDAGDKKSAMNHMKGIAQWTGAAMIRREQMAERLEHWVSLHTRERVKRREFTTNTRAESPTPDPIPNIPFSALPRLNIPVVKAPTSALARNLLDSTAARRTPSLLMRTPTSRTPFPSTPSSSSSAASSRPVSPVKSLLGDPFSSRPTTPTTPRQMTVPQTPSTTSRRAALMERVRQKALNTPSSKGAVQVTGRNADGEEVVRTLGQEDVKRRLLLGRLGGVAEAIWMLFASAPQSPSSNPTAPTRRRRAIPIEEVVRVIIKSSRTPISSAEATESVRLLASLCPDFLSSMILDGEEWLQMAPSSSSSSSIVTAKPPPSPSSSSSSGPPPSPSSARTLKPPPSPSSRRIADDEADLELRTRARARPLTPRSPGSPVKIRKEVTLRDVKERIRREMEL